jgi:hypothetical protein
MKRFPLIALLLLTLCSFLLFFVPAYIIRPFVPQTPFGVAIAYHLKLASPWTALLILLLGFLLVSRLWMTTKARWMRVGLVSNLLLMAGFAILCRVNYFEWMFHPLEHPGFVSISNARNIEDSDKVLSLLISGYSKAYPVRVMAYHHVLNDVVGGVSLVVTY